MSGVVRAGRPRRWRGSAGSCLSAPALALGLLMQGTGPYHFPLFATPTAPTAQGHVRLVFAASPFGVAFTADGRASYDVQITAAGLPEPASLGRFAAYVAWAVTPDLSRWHRLGRVTNGTTTLGRAELNKFLLVITAEARAAPPTRAGPTVLHGTSPSGWLQSFLTHPLFRGVVF